jgi:hypothetical protein
MADISDVEDELVKMIADMMYPQGILFPPVVPYVGSIKIYAGWPIPPLLEADIKNNISHVSIFPSNNGRNTTRFPQEWHERSITPATLTLIVVDNTVTVGGFTSIPQACMVIVNNIGYAYQVRDIDNLESIAAGLALLIPNSSASGDVITINGAFSIIARVTQDGIGIKEIKRQEVIMNIITWTNTRQNRTNIAEIIEVGLGKLSRFELPLDNYWAPIFYSGLRDHDELQKSYAVYRRDLMFRIEYPTTIQQHFPTITDIVTNVHLVNSIT